MKIGNAALALLFAQLFMMAGANAQLYKWVAPDGTVSYSDKPPPATAAKVERKSYASGASTVDLPYELAQAVKNSPVVLYTTKNCPACDQGRQLLNDRGIPFSEKTVNTNEDNAYLKKISGDNSAPVLTVGRNKQIGNLSQWGNMLTAAGYPTSNILPKTYTNPPAEPAAPPAKTAETSPEQKKAEQPAPSDAAPPPAATGNAPPGFQF
ncbi:MAG: glutaredoxin family protein [Burkholderiaceae bacterium]|nr:glutaredoxin family protein [Burkholderiaceae bacterium]